MSHSCTAHDLANLAQVLSRIERDTTVASFGHLGLSSDGRMVWLEIVAVGENGQMSDWRCREGKSGSVLTCFQLFRHYCYVLTVGRSIFHVILDLAGVGRLIPTLLLESWLDSVQEHEHASRFETEVERNKARFVIAPRIRPSVPEDDMSLSTSVDHDCLDFQGRSSTT